MNLVKKMNLNGIIVNMLLFFYLSLKEKNEKGIKNII